MSFVYVVPVLLFAAFGLIILLYRIIYKSNMNRALDGEATTGLIDLGSLLKALTFIALIIMNIVALSRMNNLELQLNNLQANTQSNISSLQSSISSLRATINEYFSEQKMVQNEEYTLTNIDFSNEQYEYNIEFALKEKETNADVYLVVSHGDASEKIMLSSSSLSYTHTIVLDIDEVDYEFSVLLEGTTLEQFNLFSINTKRQSDMTRFAFLGFLEGDTQEAIYAMVPETINILGNVTVSSVTFEVVEDNVRVQSETLTNVSNIDTLTAPYLKNDIYYEFGEGDYFMFIYEFDHLNDIHINVTITLSDGTEIVETLEL